MDVFNPSQGLIAALKRGDERVGKNLISLFLNFYLSP